MIATFWSRIPLQWRMFIATCTSITVLFAVAGWALERYAVGVADTNVQTQMRASMHAYEAVWKGRTQVLSASTALMSGMSDVRAAFLTRDPETIRDSAQELWARVSDTTAAFLVLDAQGHVISSLGSGASGLDASAIPLDVATRQFPKQASGFLRQRAQLFYVVLTPVYVQAGKTPLLLNILCAGFRVDALLARQLKQLAPDTEFAFVTGDTVFASTLGERLSRQLPQTLALVSTASLNPVRTGQFVITQQALLDVAGRPVAQLAVLHSYAHVLRSLQDLQTVVSLAWLLTVLVALVVSLFLTRRLLFPVKLLDVAAARIATGDYGYRVSVAGSGELARLAGTFNSMCDAIQRSQAELVRQEQMATIARLGSSLVHDLRNPLAAIYGGVEMLIDGDLASEHSRRIAVNIYRASQRMQDLLRDLLQVSKGEPRSPEYCDLRSIIDAAIDSVSTHVTDIHISISVPEGTEVLCDRTRIERVFANLIANAAEAMGAKGTITVESEIRGDGLEVSFQDDGPGLPPQIRRALFQPFVTSKRSGLGLGLALSKQTMVESGGNLILEQQQSSGARFCLQFAQARSSDGQPSSYKPRPGCGGVGGNVA